jgi:hypothetical protein
MAGEIRGFAVQLGRLRRSSEEKVKNSSMARFGSVCKRNERKF